MRQCKTILDTAALSSALQELKNTDPNPWITYACELVTPMYGGGVEAGKVDESMPIRASSIRGQLRFWWRIANGPFDDAQDMFQQEAAIWGGIGDGEEKSSKVEVRVGAIEGLKLERAFEYKKNWRDKYVPREHEVYGHAYVLFSAQGTLEKDRTIIQKENKYIALPGLKFNLNIRFEELKTSAHSAPLTEKQKEQVDKAIHWWVNFGGIGGRTRRGLGAIKVTNKNIPRIIAKELEGKGGQLVCISLPGKNNATAVDCWKFSADKLRDFRQGENVGRNPPSDESKSPAGRSRWPEADSIRNLSGCYLKKHKPKSNKTNRFPRAAFGLPIVFKFKDDPTKNAGRQTIADKEKDPVIHILQPKENNLERLASPLIIKPYWNGESWVAAALLLPGWKDALSLAVSFQSPEEAKEYDRLPKQWWDGEDSENSHPKLSDIKPMNKDGNPRADNPLSAFLDFFKDTTAKGKK